MYKVDFLEKIQEEIEDKSTSELKLLVIKLALIVAMAEVLISNNNEQTGMNYIEHFKLTFPRHRSFQQCLKEDLEFAEKK